MTRSDPTPTLDLSDDGWDRGWEAHRTRQMQRWAKWSLAEKLDWLEEAQRVAEGILEGRRKAGLPDLAPRRDDWGMRI